MPRAAGAAAFGPAALTLAACDSPTGPQPVASVDVAPAKGNVWAGTVRQLQATPRASDGTGGRDPTSLRRHWGPCSTPLTLSAPRAGS